MRVAVICEYSGTVRDAFIRAGHDAVSFDILPSESDVGPHWERDVREFSLQFWEDFDLAVCHPPCTHLSVSGARWFTEGKKPWSLQEDALEFVRWLMDLPVRRIAIENPVGVISTKIRKADQYIQPWQFGHGETKKTGLWLKNLPLLRPTDIVEGRENRIHKMGPGPERGKERSRFYAGIAKAMAEQWGGLE